MVYYCWFPNEDWSRFFLGVPMQSREVPRFAGAFFNAFIGVQFAVLALLTPLYTSGTIAEERQRRTLEFLFVTDLSNREIVLGMLAARLAGLTLLVLTGLPILGLLQLLGGVDPNLVLVAFVVTLLTMLSLVCLGILCSIRARDPLGALLLTYFWAFLFLTLTLCIQVPLAGNPLVTLVLLNDAWNQNAADMDFLVPLVRDYAIFHIVAAALCSGAAVMRLRGAPLPLWMGYPVPYKFSVDQPIAEDRNWGPFPVEEERDPDRERLLSALIPRGRPCLSVGEDAIWWKEIDFEGRGFRRTYLLWSPVLRGCVLVLVVSTVLALSLGPGFWLDPEEIKQLSEHAHAPIGALGTAVTCFTLLIVALSAAGRVVREREQRTLDSLLTTPLEPEEILFAKWAASIWKVRHCASLLGLVWVFGLLLGGLHPVALPFLAAACIVYVTFMASLGLWFSSINRTTLRAMLFTFLAALVLIVGPGFALRTVGDAFYFSPSSQETLHWDKLLLHYGLTPPVTLWTLSLHGDGLLKDPATLVPKIVAALAGLHCYILGSVLLWTSAVARLRAEKGKSQESGLRDQESGSRKQEAEEGRTGCQSLTTAHGFLPPDL